ncbi:hypothetical protein Pla52n_29010 [Stieleria varia]|uniref:Uncharacterized protein n=1 Tax=Stieleria varia TaxID=2528005 RepID=A0A5C6B0P1_9BACT|nr:hypothetical protein Pla52n_29010 [Stieleria varia]
MFFRACDKFCRINVDLHDRSFVSPATVKESRLRKVTELLTQGNGFDGC